MAGGFSSRPERTFALLGVLLVLGVAACRRRPPSASPAPSSSSAASAGLSTARDPAAPPSEARAAAPSDSSDPGPIVPAEEPALDRAIPIDACNAFGFCWVRPLPRDLDLNAIWTFAKNDAWVFGNAGLAMRWDGQRFRSVETSTFDDLVAVWASSPSNLFVLGHGGTLLRWNGDKFESLWQPADDYEATRRKEKPNAIDIRRAPPVAKHPAARAKFPDELPGTEHPAPLFNDIWGTPNGELWVAGEIETAPAYNYIPRGTAGVLRHFDGKKWESQTWETSAARTAVWGTSPNDVFLWSDQEHVVHFEGTGWWAPRFPPRAVDFQEFHARNLGPEYVAVWQARPEDSWVVRHRDAGDLVERVNHRSGQARAGSRLARLAFLKDTVRDIRGTASDDVWLVGKGGLLLHFDGVRWHGLVPSQRPPAEEFQAAWAVTPDDVWFVGSGVLRFDGNAWIFTPRPPGTGTLRSVWGAKSDAVWAVTDDALFFFDGKTWAEVPLPEKSKLTTVRGIGAKVWIIGDGGSRLFVGSREGFTPVDPPSSLNAGYSLVLRGPDDALLIGKAVYHWDSRGLSRSESELEALVQETPLHTLVSARGSGVLFGQSKGDFVRVESAKIATRAEALGGGRARFAGPGGSFFAASGHGIVSYEDGAFRFAPLHAEDSIVDIAGDEQNVWVLGFRGMILRKRLRPH